MSVIFRSVKDGWLLLSEKGSRFRLILASTLLAFAFVTPMMIGVYLPVSLRSLIVELPEYINGILESNGITNVSVIELTEDMIAELEVSLAYDLTIVFGALITLPAFAFFMTYTWRTYSKARYGFVDSERKKKGSYNYFRGMMAGFLMLIFPLICFAILQLGYYEARVMSEVMTLDEIALPMILPLIIFWAVGLAVSALILWLTNYKFFVPYYYGRGMTLREANRRSKAICKKHPFICDGFSLIFGVATALSLVSVGVLFILLVLPLMMFTYYSLAEHLDGKKLLED